MFRGMNPIVKSIIVSILFAAVCASGMCFRDVFIEHKAIELNWMVIIAAGVLWFACDMIRLRINN